MEILVTDDMVEALLPAEMGRPADSPQPRIRTRHIGTHHPGDTRRRPRGRARRRLTKLDAALGDISASWSTSMRGAARADARRARPERAHRDRVLLSLERHQHRTRDRPLPGDLPRRALVRRALCQRAGDVRSSGSTVSARCTLSASADIAAAAPGRRRRRSLPGPGAVTVELRLDPRLHGSPTASLSSPAPRGIRGPSGGDPRRRGTAWLERLLLQLGPTRRCSGRRTSRRRSRRRAPGLSPLRGLSGPQSLGIVSQFQIA